MDRTAIEVLPTVLCLLFVFAFSLCVAARFDHACNRIKEMHDKICKKDEEEG
jgi:hypothetical protein